MKLSLKLPLAFTVSLLLLFAAALFGISRLNQALDTYQTTVAQSFEHERMAADMLNNFKVQVQEWKNVLLRGKDPAQLTRYWAAFEKQEKAIKDEAQKLVVALPPGEGRERVQQFFQAHERMGAAYRKGFEAFKAADHDPQAGDKAVAGMDREPSQLLDQAGDLIAQASSEVAERAAATAQRATTISLVVMLVVCALGIAGAVAFSRTVVNPLDNAVRVSQAVAGGDLTVAQHVQGKDEIAMLLNALLAHLGQPPLDLSGPLAAILVLGLVQGAYASEIFRAAIQAIPFGQIEAGKAFGLHGFALFRRVTLPIMAPYALAGMANLWINLIKDSALISVVGTNELLYTAKQGAGSTRHYLLFYLTAAALYYAVTLLSNYLSGRLERRIRRWMPLAE